MPSPPQKDKVWLPLYVVMEKKAAHVEKFGRPQSSVLKACAVEMESSHLEK